MEAGENNNHYSMEDLRTIGEMVKVITIFHDVMLIVLTSFHSVMIIVLTSFHIVMIIVLRIL
jgi:hypothetical protein